MVVGEFLSEELGVLPRAVAHPALQVGGQRHGPTTGQVREHAPGTAWSEKGTLEKYKPYEGSNLANQASWKLGGI